MKLAGGLALALAAACALNIGFYVQHDAAGGAGHLSLRHPLSSLLALFTNRQWLIGYVTGWVGWGLYLAALWLAPLSLVQSVVAGGVGILALLAQRFGTRVSGRERLGTLLAIGGLVLLCCSLAGQATPSHPASTGDLLAVLITGCVIAGGLAAAAWRFHARATLLATCAGLLYAMSDVAAKGCVGGDLVLFGPFVLAGAALAFVALQLSFQQGGVMATAGVCNLVNNAVPIAAGLFLFHESIPKGFVGALRLAAFVCVVVGAVLMARQPAATPMAPDLPVPVP